MEHPGPVLVTGACGLVGRATVARLLEQGRSVVATDLRTPVTEKVADSWGDPSGPGRLRVAWCDLTDPAAVGRLVVGVGPAAVIHLAAVIPPLCYARPEVARAVNVDATRNLLAAVPAGTRFVQASSVAVYGARNPFRHTGLLTAELEMAPTDLYGVLKAEAETAVRASALDWVVLRLGGVMTTEQRAGLDLDVIHFESLLPVDGRIQTVDVRDVARAFAAATTAPVSGEALLIGGDESHRIRQGQITPAMTAALGLDGGIPVGRPGDPDDDGSWFATDWMDTTRAQEALDFQRITWPDLLAEIRATSGRRRYLLRLLAPVLHEVFRRTNARRGTVAPFAPQQSAHA
ncbi:NAD(P)-dependent oxidoreductase [soil metagenome]